MRPDIKEVTNSLAKTIAKEFEYSINIDHFSATGNNKPFKRWLIQFKMGYISESLNNWITNNINPYTCTSKSKLTTEETIMVYWYSCGFVVIGVTTSGECWIIPGDEDCSLVENYQEINEE